MTRRLLPAALLLALAFPALADEAPAPVPVPAIAMLRPFGEAIRLGPGDVLSVAVARLPELSRDAAIAGDGAIRLAGAGAIPVAGRTLDEAQAAVAEALAASFGVEPRAVLVDVARYRPVVVHGDGRKGGEIEFRPGLTVRQAVAATGGLRIDLAGSLTEALEAERTVAQLGEATDRLARARAAQARLRAERDGGDIAAADLDGLRLAPGRREEIVAAEAKLRQIREQRFAEQQDNLGRQRDSVARQIDSLAREMELQRHREALAQEDLRASEDLSARGLGTRDRLRDSRTDLVEVQLLIVRIMAERSSAETQLAITESLITDGVAARQLELAELLRQAESEIATATRDAEAARRAVGLAEAHIGGMGPQEDESLAYVIERGAEAVEAAPATVLMPGDVLRVVRR